MPGMPILARAACLLPLFGIAWSGDGAPMSEIRLRSGESLVGRVLQDDGAWMVVDLDSGTIASIERARVSEVRPLSAVGASRTASASPSAPALRGWTLGVSVGWGWTTTKASADFHIYDSGTSSAYQIRGDRESNGFDDFPTITVSLLTDHATGPQRPVVLGAQLCVMPGDVINPDAPVWSLEGVGGLRWGRTTTFDLRVAAGPAFTTCEWSGLVLGSNGLEPYDANDTAFGWQTRAEAVLDLWMGPSAAIQCKLGASYRRLLPDLSFTTPTYSGEISAESTAIGVYAGIGLDISL